LPHSALIVARLRLKGHLIIWHAPSTTSGLHYVMGALGHAPDNSLLMRNNSLLSKMKLHESGHYLVTTHEAFDTMPLHHYPQSSEPIYNELDHRHHILRIRLARSISCISSTLSACVGFVAFMHPCFNGLRATPIVYGS
jgi:hypothetical protein